MLLHIRIIVVVLLCQVINKSSAQYMDNYWVFGDSAAIDWTNPLIPNVKQSSYFYRNGSCSIGDTNGLILYAGLLDNNAPLNCYIWNKFDKPIVNSNSIYGGAWYHSSLLVPNPSNDSMLYLFTIGVAVGEQFGLYYSTINYKINNDSGIVVQKNVQLNNYPEFDALMGIKHGNGRDWWIVTQRWFPPSGVTTTNTFNFYLISPIGISIPLLQSIGSVHSTNLGHLVFSNDGDLFANISIRGLIELYNFDRCTGLITSTIPIEQESTTSSNLHWYSSCAFSPDDSKLYVLEYSQTSLPHYLWQFDLTASNISSSKTAIDSFPGTPYGIYQLKLAHNCKIYLSAFDQNFSWPYPDTSIAFTSINNNLSVINYPDSLGAACDFQPFSFNLGPGRSYFGLPNNPKYELSAWVGSPCDTLSVGVDDFQPPPQAFFQSWYNSEWNMIHVNASKLKGSKATLRLVDVEGRLVYEKETGVIAGGYVTTEINMQGIAKGMYIVSLLTEKEYLSGKVMK